MTLTQQLILITLITCTTLLTRFLPFIIFRSDRLIPPVIQYFGSILPPAIFGLLVIYALRDIKWSSFANSLPALAAIIVIVLIHLRKRNMLLSIAVGTLTYIILLRI